MNQKFLIILIISSCLILFTNCKKLVTETTPAGQLEKIKLETLDNIPLEYGKLMAITAHAQYEGWAQLWFMDESSTIRMVRIEFHFNRVHEDVLVIPRK